MSVTIETTGESVKSAVNSQGIEKNIKLIEPESE
jgi:hypothetical protein